MDARNTRAQEPHELTAQARLVVPLGGQAHTIREMLATLETLSSAGQRHTMSKIVAFVGAHLPRAGQRDDPRHEGALAESIAWLRQESDRAVPDVVTFCRRAEELIASLSAARC